MVKLSLLVLLVSLFFYVEEWSSEKPNIIRTGVYAIAVIVGMLCLSYTT